ncbi:hypothetical protein B0H19DRAFT_1184524 [Mycena capillaripes]|nr:hypothetical protein B0H19DRAFT_1184524 [Mycena capillaripes]
MRCHGNMSITFRICGIFSRHRLATMKKSVQFSDTNIMYSPLPWSPSPGASTSSLPSSPSVAAPPQLPEFIPDDIISPPSDPEPTYSRFAAPKPLIYSPWPSPPPLATLPRQEHIPIPCRAQIHSLLAFAPFMPPNVHYDLSHPLHTLNPQLTPSFLDPATYPPLPALTVLCPHISWPMAVHPSQPTGFVSVLDVFMSVYTSLRLAVGRSEYDTLASGDARRRVDDAYFTRCRLLADVGERRIEALKGVKRVDFLAGRTRFLGLSGPVDGAHVWELNVS